MTELSPTARLEHLEYPNSCAATEPRRCSSVYLAWVKKMMRRGHVSVKPPSSPAPRCVRSAAVQAHPPQGHRHTGAGRHNHGVHEQLPVLRRRQPGRWRARLRPHRLRAAPRVDSEAAARLPSPAMILVSKGATCLKERVAAARRRRVPSGRHAHTRRPRSVAAVGETVTSTTPPVCPC